MNVISFLAYQGHRRTRKHKFGFSLLATPIVYAITGAMLGGIRYLSPAVATPAVLVATAVSVTIIFSIGVFLQTWWWPILSSLPTGFFIISVALYWISVRGSDDPELGYTHIAVIVLLVYAALGLVAIGISSALGVAAGKRRARAARRRGPTRTTRASRV